MTEVTFLDSLQGHQTKRIREIAERVRKHWPDLSVKVVEGEAARGMLAEHKLNFGPAIVIDGTLEYVGIPRWRFLQERLAQVVRGLPNPRTAAPPTPAKPTPPAKPVPQPAAKPGPDTGAKPAAGAARKDEAAKSPGTPEEADEDSQA